MNKLFINLVKPILILILTIGECMQIEANDNLLLIELKSRLLIQ